MSTTAATEVDPAVWFAVAGAKVKIPSINSLVYYFPQGHFGNTSGNIQSSGFPIGPAYITCRVLSVQFLCSNPSNQVFAKIRLRPATTVYGNNNHNTHDCARQQQSQNRNDDVVSFVKILSSSDLLFDSFFMPKLCADRILPPLDSAANVAVQNLTIKDTSNKEWTFDHACHMPQLHFLSTGWIKFVFAKRLTAGDSIVFMRKKSTNELFLGIRRAAVAIDVRSGAAGVVAAIGSAAKGEMFEVDYYPRFGWPEFVVEAEKVKAALRVSWRVGMKVRVAVENKDLSSVNWLKGMVKAVLWPERLPRSPWRILEVNCDFSGILPDIHRVSPWEVNPMMQGARLDNEPLTVINSIRLFGTNIHISNSEQQQDEEEAQQTNVPPQL